MALQVNSHTAAKGREIRIAPPVYVAFETRSVEEDSGIQVERRLSEALCECAGLQLRSIDTLIVTSSLPRTHRALLGPTLARAIGIDVGRLLEISGSCGSVIDALHYAFGCGSPSERIVIMAVDSFATSYAAASAGNNWVDGGGVIDIIAEGRIKMTLEAYVTASDLGYLEMAHPLGGQVECPFEPQAVNGFREADKYAIEVIVNEAVREARIERSNIAALVTVNRSTESLRWVPNWLGSECLFAHSRQELSHAGGADVVVNLRDALEVTPEGYICILGTGLGYIWHAMLIRVGR